MSDRWYCSFFPLSVFSLIATMWSTFIALIKIPKQRLNIQMNKINKTLLFFNLSERMTSSVFELLLDNCLTLVLQVSH